MKIIKNQKKIHSQRNSKDKEGINLIQIETILNLMQYVHARNRSIDSTFYYHEKIIELTNDPGILADSYGRLAYACSLNNMKVKAIDYYEKGLNIKRKFKNKEKLVSTLVNITNYLIKLESYEHAKHHITELTQAIESNPESNIYENRKQLVKIMQAKLLTAKKKYKEALQILNKIDSTKIKKEKIIRRYFNILSETYKGINNFSLGELYLDKAYIFNENILDISNIRYYVQKLSYALHANNLKKSDTYFKKINKIILNNDKYKSFQAFYVFSRYYASKKEFQKAFVFLKKATLLKNNSDRINAKNKSEVDSYFIKFNKELQAMKQLADLKDAVITKNRTLYINTTLFIVFISFSIIALLIAIYYISRTFRKKTEYQNEIKILSEKTILESKQRFLENMSHEIRTPITSIMGYLTLLQENSLNIEKRKKYTTKAYANTQKMITDLNSFLTLLRAEKGKLNSNKNNNYTKWRLNSIFY